MSNHPSMPPSAAAPVPTTPGTILADKYRVERILGQGGMGVVVEARHIALDERVALKFLLPEYASHPEASARFLREARAAVRIKSEHVARVSDVGRLDSGAPYMVMEFLEGSDLSRTLEKQGVLNVDDAVDYLIQGSEAISEAHSLGIVHRDLKPANLFLSKRPNGMPIIKVLDFGISKTQDSGVDNLTKTTAAMGSALYMSPEQMQQTRGVDHRTDIYALGISLYELLAGRQPFYAETMPQLCAEIFTGVPTPIRELRPEVPEGLAAVLEKAYARDRELRYQSVGEFVVALAPWAPQRTQSVIDSVARMGGLEAPKAGAPPRGPVGLASTGPNMAARGGTMVMAESPSGIQPLRGLTGNTGGLQTTGMPPTTGSAMVATTPPARPRTNGAVVALAVIGVLAMVGGGGFVAYRSVSAQKAVVATAASPSAPEAVPAAKPTASVAAVETASAPATAAPAAAPTASVAVAAAPSTPPAAQAGSHPTVPHHAGRPAPLPPAQPPVVPAGGGARSPWDRAGF